MNSDFQIAVTILGENLSPYVVNGAFGILGAFALHFWNQARGRRIPISWTANFQKITPVGKDPIFSKIQVQLNGAACPNLHSCEIALRNESSRDVENFDVLITFQPPFYLLHGVGGLESSAKALLFSPGYQGTVGSIFALSEEQRKQHGSYDYVIRNREFRLESLNCGELAKFNFLINSEDQAGSPYVVVSTEKAGLKIVSRPPEARLWDVSLKYAVAWGLIGGIALVIGLSVLAFSPLTLAMLSFIVGGSASLIGVAAVRLLRWVKRTLA